MNLLSWKCCHPLSEFQLPSCNYIFQNVQMNFVIVVIVVNLLYSTSLFFCYHFPQTRMNLANGHADFHFLVSPSVPSLQALLPPPPRIDLLSQWRQTCIQAGTRSLGRCRHWKFGRSSCKCWGQDRFQKRSSFWCPPASRKAWACLLPWFQCLCLPHLFGAGCVRSQSQLKFWYALRKWILGRFESDSGGLIWLFFRQ